MSKKEESKVTSLRLTESAKEFASVRGHGNMGEGILDIIDSFEQIVKQFRPRKKFSKMELQAIAGANKGTIWKYRIAGLPGDMAANIEDYPHCEGIEARQWKGVDYQALAQKVRELNVLECVSLMDSITEMFELQKNMYEIIAPSDEK